MPISKVLSKVQSTAPGHVIVCGSFEGSGSLGVTNVELKGGSVSRLATGSYELILPGNGEVRARSVSLQTKTTGSWCSAVVTSVTPASRSVTFTTFKGATPAATDLISNEVVYFTIVCENSKAL